MMEDVPAAGSKPVPERSDDGAAVRQPGETAIPYSERPHPLALLPPGAALAVAIALALAAWRAVPSLTAPLGIRSEAAAPFETVWHWFLIAVPVIVGCNFLLAILELRTTVYAVNGSEATMRTGLIRVTSSTVYLRKVEAMVRDQGPLERLCDCGTVTLVGTGGGRETLSHVRRFSTFIAALERSLPAST